MSFGTTMHYACCVLYQKPFIIDRIAIYKVHRTSWLCLRAVTETKVHFSFSCPIQARIMCALSLNTYFSRLSRVYAVAELDCVPGS
jgi:hypothetical protein